MDLENAPADRSSPRRSPRKLSPTKKYQTPLVSLISFSSLQAHALELTYPKNTTTEPPKTPKNPEGNSRRHAQIPPFIPTQSPPSSEPIFHAGSSHRAPTTADDFASISPAKTSSSSGPKLANNVRNVRESLGDEGFYFENEEKYNEYPEIQELMDQVFFTERASAMRPASLLKIKTWRKGNETASEDQYYANLLPQIVGESRTTVANTFSAEAESQSKSFSSDELHQAKKVVLNRGVLYKDGKGIEKKLGLTNPVPDVAWGLRVPKYPSPSAPQLSNAATALIKLASGIRHPFFVIEEKGSDESIEGAENQAIRSGAALVEARRQLKELAREKGENEAVGVDLDCIAFSCSWTPQYAKIHVHWHELTKEGYSLWHMNVLQGYMFLQSSHMSDFRRDIHNILDWGLSPARKDTLYALELKLAAKHAAS